MLGLPVVKVPCCHCMQRCSVYARLLPPVSMREYDDLSLGNRSFSVDGCAWLGSRAMTLLGEEQKFWELNASTTLTEANEGLYARRTMLLRFSCSFTALWGCWRIIPQFGNSNVFKVHHVVFILDIRLIITWTPSWYRIQYTTVLSQLSNGADAFDGTGY